MTEEGGESAASALPANARIETISFNAGGGSLEVTLRGVEQRRSVDAESIDTLAGGRIRHQSLTYQPGSVSVNPAGVATTLATGVPVGMFDKKPAISVAGEELHHALGMRITGVDEVWYLLAQSFNFRKALGPDAAYSTEINLRAFVKRLAEFASSAKRDAYVDAIVAKTALPPPMESLFEFLRTMASK